HEQHGFQYSLCERGHILARRRPTVKHRRAHLPAPRPARYNTPGARGARRAGGMTEAEWAACEDPAAMLAAMLLSQPGLFDIRTGLPLPAPAKPSDRKLRPSPTRCTGVRLTGGRLKLRRPT